MTKIAEEQTPKKLGSVAHVPECWWDTQLWWEVSHCQVLSVRRESNVPENLHQGKGTTGEDTELSGLPGITTCWADHVWTKTPPFNLIKSVTVLGTTVFLCFIGALAPSVMTVLNLLEALGTLVLQSFHKCLSFFVPWLLLFMPFNFKQINKKTNPNLEQENVSSLDFSSIRSALIILSARCLAC